MAMTEYTPPSDPWIEVVYEDENIMAVNKPAGLLSVPGRLPEHYDSMWSRIVERDREIQVIHRLDMATSGLMLLAKDKASESALKKQFQYRLTHLPQSDDLSPACEPAADENALSLVINVRHWCALHIAPPDNESATVYRALHTLSGVDDSANHK